MERRGGRGKEERRRGGKGESLGKGGEELSKGEEEEMSKVGQFEERRRGEGEEEQGGGYLPENLCASLLGVPLPRVCLADDPGVAVNTPPPPQSEAIRHAPLGAYHLSPPLVVF